LTGGAHVGEFAEVSEYIMNNVFAIGGEKLPSTEVVE
jgi:hypothetical protein